MDPDAMTTLLGDAICNIEEEEHWEACQHALRSPYEAWTSDKDEEGWESPSDDDEGSDSKSDSSSEAIAIVTMEIARMIAIVIAEATIVKTMLANIVTRIGRTT